MNNSPRAFVLMTAMPPTKGHVNLIRFAAGLAREVRVIVCTQPDEPYTYERFEAVKAIAAKINYSAVMVHHLHKQLPQDPATPGFWEMWHKILTEGDNDMTGWWLDGLGPGDYFVSSEPYGERVAEITGSTFIPYDPDRELLYTKATNVRDDPYSYFSDIAHEFQHVLRTNVTVFGAESTGKTTLSKEISARGYGQWFFEWARPYLETVGPDINVNSMTAIWKGQLATQIHSMDFYDKPLHVFDTDLFSTIGYWEQPHWQDKLGPAPWQLQLDAQWYKSDLYIITKSNIPFEQDPLRYGGDHRESSDEYWIDVAERHQLNYIVLESDSPTERRQEALAAIFAVQNKKYDAIRYNRRGF